MNSDPAEVRTFHPAPVMRLDKGPGAGLCFLVLALSAVTANAQPAPVAYPGSVEGRVTCNDGGFPARKAHVSLSLIELLNPKADSRKFPRFESNTDTDYDGRYIIRGVPPGIYLVHVHLAGYTDDVGLAEQVIPVLPPDRQKELLAALPQVAVQGGRAHADVVLRRGAAISGRATYDNGGPLNGARVNVIMVSGDLLENGGTGTKPGPLEIRNPQAATDDRGTYRIAGLPKGRYRISVEAEEIVFAPGVLKESEAKLFSVDEPDEILDADITVPIDSLFSIDGVVTRGGSPVPDAQVMIERSGQRGSSDTRTGSDGHYRFRALSPGTYTVYAYYPPFGSDNHSPQVERTIKVQLGNIDITDADIDLLRRPPAE